MWALRYAPPFSSYTYTCSHTHKLHINIYAVQNYACRHDHDHDHDHDEHDHDVHAHLFVLCV